MTGSTISGTLTTGITLGVGAHTSPLTITSTGAILSSGTDIVIPQGANTVFNYGSLESPGSLPNDVSTVYTSATLFNAGVISGHVVDNYTNIFQKTALVQVSGYLSNSGLIEGGVGFTDGPGGVALAFLSGIGINTGTIIGGAAGAESGPFNLPGDNGGYGLDMGGSFTNSSVGLIKGGNGGVGGNGAVDGGTLINFGTILSGNDGISISGDGVVVSDNGIFKNYGMVKGATGAVVSRNSTLTNFGTVIGSVGVSISNGTLINEGAILSQAGSVAIEAGTLGTVVLMNTDFSGVIVATASSGDVLELSGSSPQSLTGIGVSITNFSTIKFDSNSEWHISGTYSGAYNYSGFDATNVITGFTFGDSIDLTNFQATSETYVSGTGLILGNGTTAETLGIEGSLTTADISISSDMAAGTIIDVTCYAKGTKISTSNGDLAVEDLTIGQYVRTLHSGMQKVKWIGHRSYVAPFANHVKVLPVCIRAGAIADGVPRQDLFVSPGHAICINGVLIHASNLVNGVSITQATSVEAITYYHVELEIHEVIFAENCPAETFMGEYFRQQFHNAAEYQALYPGQSAPEVMCLTRLDSGFQLQAIRQDIAARAGIEAPQCVGELRGFVDQAGPEACSGWAQDISAPEEPVCLFVFVGGQVAGRVLANIPRADLQEAGLGTGRHGFEFSLPQNIAGQVSVRRVADGACLAYADAFTALAA